MRILFFLNHDGFVRNFEPALRTLKARGHEVHLALGSRRRLLMARVDSIEQLAAELPGLTYDELGSEKHSGYTALLHALCASRDYLRYLEPRYADAPKLRARAEGYAPPGLRRLERTGPAGRKVLDALLLRAIRSIPTSEGLDAYIRAQRPDVILLTPLVGLGLSQHGILQSALASGIPSGLLVHSWDNLTNKGRIHRKPHLVAVWNEDMKREAVELHGVPEDRVAVTGAHPYDEWFGYAPTTTREQFCNAVGLDAGRPFVLYVGSSGFVAPREAYFAARWLSALRASGRPELREIGALLRPHPQNEEHWHDVRLEEPGLTALWPSGAETGTEARAGYFDSIYHAAAVVGVNTSALVESSIVGRPTLTLVDDSFRDTQEGTLHFSYLAGEGGALEVAHSFEEHEEQLSGVVSSPEEHAEQARKFVQRFVRPFGVDVEAAPMLADAVEGLAALGATEPARSRLPRIVLAGPAAYARRQAGKLRARRPAAAPPAAPRILFFMQSINFDRLFEAALRGLLERGCRVHVALDVEKLGRSGETTVFEALRARFPDFSYGPSPYRCESGWKLLARHLRLAIDYLHFLEPAFHGADSTRRRAEERCARIVPWLTRRAPLRGRLGRRLLGGLLRALERAVPVERRVRQYVEDFEPDAVLVTPLVELGSVQGEYIRVARRLRVPSALLVASWDNLTNKGVVRDVPDLTLVWNEAQRREAAKLHGIPEERVAVTGASVYDQWFAWTPATTREEFCAKTGLDPDRPIILYVGSSQFIAPDEPDFAKGWLELLRESSDPRIREAAVLFRPHPANVARWDEADLEEDGRTALWPRGGAKPIDRERKSDYFDSLFHADVVVGINTSALIEAAIVGRPVLTLLSSEYRGSQEGTLHFRYLQGNGVPPLLEVARTPEEHEAQLRDALERGSGERVHPFVETFVRPHGLGKDATPFVVEALVRLVGRAVMPDRRAGSLLLRAAMWPVAVLAGATQRRRVRGRGRRPARKRILLVLDHPGFLLFFDQLVHHLDTRGVEVHLAFARPEKWPEGLEALGRLRHARLHLRIPERNDKYAFVARGIRRAADYIHYLHPNLAAARYSRKKWRELAAFPFGTGLLRRRKRLPDWVARGLLRLLSAFESAIPSDRTIESFIGRLRPRAVVVSPLVDARTDMTDYVKSARRLGISTALCVASWDNLSSKGLIRIVPDRMTVWNETQRQELLDFHWVPPERIVVTGAQPYDRWFVQTPSSDRAEFLERFGLPPDRDFVLFACSTQQKQSEELEPLFVRRWIEALRNADDPLVRELSVLIRPHPTNVAAWDEVDVSSFENVAVWHRDYPLPVRHGDRAEYFDGLHHCAALVAINSTAMVEAAILGRPVHTVALPELRALQHDLVHYHYLLPANGGFVREAKAFDEHVRLLAADLRDPDQVRALDARFVESFVRPQGLERPSTPELVAAVENVLNVTPENPPRRPLLLPLLGLLTLARLALRGRERRQRQPTAFRPIPATPPPATEKRTPPPAVILEEAQTVTHFRAGQST